MTDPALGRIALVSSFGAESAVLLHMISHIDPDLPVLILETGMLFEETRHYRALLTDRFGLGDVRLIRPDPDQLALIDPDDTLHRRAPDTCCHIRKVAPLERALAGFDTWITGRKRFQAQGRSDLPVLEMAQGGRLKLNPLARWTPQDLRRYAESHDLPSHPLVARGYPSIGCAPCTTPVKPGEDPRAGRWRDQDKVECGIHIVDGRIIRNGAPA